MTLLGSQDTGLGSVDTASGGQGEGGGGGDIEEITSTDASVTITGPTGPITNLSVPAAQPPGSAVTGLSFPIVAGTPTLSAVDPVVLPGLVATGGGVEVAAGNFVVDVGVPATIHGTLEVDGATTMNGALNANNGVAVQNGETVQGGLEVVNGTFVTDAGVPATIHDTLEVDGATTMNGPLSANNGAAILGLATADGQVIVTESSVAAWPLGGANRRVFLVDGVNGSDANAGFLDSPVAFPLSGATVAATAKKTLAGLAACFPLDLQGRIFELIIATGTYADGLQAFMATLANVPSGCLIRGTVTNATAGSTAFAGNIADALMAGYVTATGMNAAGYNPTGAPTNQVVQCLQVGGGAPAFAAEPARPLGVRIRFDSATTTVALRNVCRQVQQVTGTDTLTINAFETTQKLPAVPVAADVFYIEEPGVIVPASTIANDSGSGQELQLVGIKSSAGLTFRFGGFLLVGVGASALTGTECRSLTPSTGYTHPSLGAVVSGGGGRIEGAANYSLCVMDLSSLVVVGRATLNNCQQANFNNSFVVGAGLVYNGNRALSAQSTGIGVTVVILPTARVIGPVSGGTEGGVNLRDTAMQIDQLSITNAGAAPALRLESQVYLFLVGTPPGVSPISGSAGNTDVGLDLTFARGSVVVIDPSVAPTLTGSAGDVRLAGNIIISWAALIAGKGITDIAGNRVVIGNSAVVNPTGFSIGPVSVVGKFSGLITQAEGAVFNYLSDDGIGEALIPGTNQVDPNRYPTSQRIISRLRACVPLGTPVGGAVTFTLYKNGVATAMTCTIAASSGAGTKASDLVHPILFGDGDDYDLRADAGVIPSNIAVSAILEGPS
jgi:hypothetical protein